MEKCEGERLLVAHLTAKEWKRIPTDISKKISEFVTTKLDEFVTDRARAETAKFNAEKALKDLQVKYENVSTSFEETKAKFEASARTIEELESQLSTATQDVARLQSSCTKFESENAELRRQRNLAVDEKEDLFKIIERRTGEVERLQMELQAISKQLEAAITAKCEALAKADEVESKMLNIDYREKRIEQERQLFDMQIQSLTQDLNQRTDELLNLRRDNTLRCIQLETKLNERNQEYAASLENIKKLTEVNNSLTQRAEELVAKLSEEKETMIKTQESFQQELAAQTKLANLYKQVSEDKIKYADELAKGLAEVKEKLNEAIEQYGDLETKHREAELAHEEILEKKNECIEVLKKELETANEVLNNTKLEYSEKKLEELCPTASHIPKSSRSGTLTLTQLMTEVNKLSDELADKNEENAKLNAYLTQVQQTIHEKAPLLIKQREEYETALENIEELTKANDLLTNEIQQLREDMAECRRSESAVTRENDRLNKDILDLSRQVCHLLREVEVSRIGGSSVNSTDTSDSLSSADIISKNLVTFNDIQSLQATNQKLLAVVRELSSKQEEAEAFDPSEIIKLNTRLEVLTADNKELLEQQDRNSKLIKRLTDQREVYKNMFLQAKKGEDIILPPELRETQESQSSTKDDTEEKDEKIQELQTKLESAKKEYVQLKEDSDNYRKEKAAHEQILIEQLDKTRNELQTYINSNARLVAKCETNDELFKTLKNNTEIYKKQVEKLEERCKMYNESIIKHETTISYLRDQALDTQSKLTKVEVTLSNLEKENALLKDSEKRLMREREHLKAEKHSTTILHSNIELIKATLERKDAECKIHLEEQLKEAHRELAAMRRRLQEEQDRYRTLSNHLEKQTQNAQSRMEEEKQQADKLRKELAELRDEYTAKSQQIETLSKKLKSVMFTGADTPDNKQIREMQKSYENAQSEIESLQQKLKAAKESISQHSNVAEAAEKQLQQVLSSQKEYTEATEKKLKENEKLIADLQEKCSELQGELSVQTDGQESVTLSMRSKIKNLESSQESNASELNITRQELENAREQIKQLTENLETAEAKYTREMMLHSADLSAFAALKEDLAKLNTEIAELTHQRDEAKHVLEENKAGWAAREELYGKEKEELEKRFKDMDSQNTLLLDQLQALNTQLSAIQSQQLPESMNVSIGDTSLNRSLTEEDGKSSDQLLKIIKYLRQEKDIAVSKCEILEVEHVRIKTQQSLINKQLEDAKAALESERQKSEVNIVTSAKHAEVLRKVETLNAITDSNRALRIERDNLLIQLNELKARTFSLEEQLGPLQEKNKELSIKAEAMHTENITLRGEATRWRQRANILIEKSNRTSPEDWKKLQNERENLAKQLTIEKANTTKLTEELNTTKQEKTRLEEQLRQVKQMQVSQKQELDHLTEELGALQAQVTTLNQDLAQARDAQDRAAKENATLKEELENRNANLNDLKNNMVQIRKIAKKYKTQCEEMTKELEQYKQKPVVASGSSAETGESSQEQPSAGPVEERITALESTHKEQINTLNAQIETLSSANENFKKEIEVLKQSSAEKEERFKIVFKNAKDRIMMLNEQLKEKKDGAAGTSSEGQNVDTNALQSSVERLEKEKEEIIAEKQQEKEKMSSEIESLTQRVNQLQRQLGLQQGSKPSTSSGPTEKSSTEPPTANIKPMAGHSTNTQTQAVTIQPWRSGGEPPLASIRPMSMQLRTVAVPPTSQSPSAVMVTPQQVHTTGSSNVEAMSSSPTSSHTDYGPATSSASSAQMGPRQAAVPPTQSTQDTEDEDANAQGQSVPQQQAVALVLPRVEPPSSGSTEQGTSSAGSSNTVTTTQAGHKRPRDADDSCQSEEQSKSQPQTKRTRVLGTEAFQGVSESGLVVEYQVPTSSQRDHEEEPDAVIVVESDEEGDVPDEGEGADDEPDDADGEGYDMEGIAYPEQEMNYEDDCQDVNLGNEVEVIEDSSEVPNQSEHSAQEGTSQEENTEQPQSEAISSGSDGNSGVTVSQASTSHASTLPSLTRTRQVAPLSRSQQSHLMLPHGMDEGGDDGIVPSTPTLCFPRRSDGFGEAVSSPHVPTSGRFTFNEPGAQSNLSSNEVVPEHALEMSSVDDNSTGRSVPSTPLQSSPQEYRSGLDEAQNLQPEDIPTITISAASDDVEQAPEGSSEMGPPGIAGTSTEQSQSSEQPDDLMESEDGVTSEGEKPPTAEEGEEEGREAEASPSTNTRSRSSRGGITSTRRGMRQGMHGRGSNMQRANPTPIIWGGDQRNSPRNDMRGGRGAGYSRVQRRARARNQRVFSNRF